MNKKNIYYLLSGLAVGLLIMYFGKDLIDNNMVFKSAPAKAK